MPGRGKPHTPKSPEPKRNNGTSTAIKREELSSPRSTSKTEEIPTPAMMEQTAKKKGLKKAKSVDDNAAVSTQTKTKETTRRKSAKGYSDRPTSPEMTDDQELKQTACVKATTPRTKVQPDKQETLNHTVRGARPKTCGARAKSPEPKHDNGISTVNKREELYSPRSTSKILRGEIFTPAMKEQAAKRNGLKQDKSFDDNAAVNTVRPARPNTSRARAKSPEEEKENRKNSEILEDCKPRTRGERAKSPTGEVVDDNKKADAAKKEEASRLYATLEKLKIRKTERSEIAKVINEIQDVILRHLRNNTQCFKDVEEPLHTGSYYENLKISNPDEFDIMFPIVVERVDMQQFTDDGAFYSVSLKRGNSKLKKFQPDSQILSACDMLNEFRNEVIKSIKTHPGVQIDRKKKGCPAVTLTIKVNSRQVSVDIVLSLAVQSSWPPITNDGFPIEEWLGRKVKQNYKRMPFYLVPKYEGKASIENNGVLAKDAWRVSFSHVEKDIFKSHGSVKTCCEEDGVPCCRKNCLKLLKYLLGLLKDQDKSFDKFCSYHAKTAMLHACCSRPKDSQWATADLSQCFNQLLEDFEGYLQRGQLNNFFIPTQNLLSGCSRKSCKSLEMRIRQEREDGFPIF